MKVKFLLLLCLFAVVASCSTGKQNMKYFSNIDSTAINIASPEYAVKVIPDDELVITVNSLVPEATSAFNAPLANTGSSRTERQVSSQPTLQSYIVSPDGYITMPILGKVKVEGLTTRQISELISSEVSKTVKDPYVRVQLMNFRVNVLGEVNKPGAIAVTKERYSVLDALADAEDLTVYGKRESVLLIREEGDKITHVRLNLNDAALLTSPYFYLRQNDVIYVEPNKILRDNSKYSQYNGYKLSVISTIVSAASVIASLVIALTVK